MPDGHSVYLFIMTLRDALLAPALLGYDKNKGLNQPAQKALINSRREILKYVPIGFLVKNSGVQRNLPSIPWISILNPELTKTTRSGLYLVYLYSLNLNHLYL